MWLFVPVVIKVNEKVSRSCLARVHIHTHTNIHIYTFFSPIVSIICLTTPLALPTAQLDLEYGPFETEGARKGSSSLEKSS